MEKRQGEQCQHRIGGFRKGTLYLSLNTLDFVDVYKFMTYAAIGERQYEMPFSKEMTEKECTETN